MTHVLLVDDDRELSDMLALYLSREGFHVTAVHDGEAGESEALSGRHAIVVLDVMLPGRSGLEVLRRLRSRHQVPVLLLTARGDSIDRIAGLDLGADDYVPKPCTPGELVARIRAILRRSTAPTPALSQSACIDAGPLLLWPGSRRAQWQGRPLELTGAEFSLLEQLARNAGQLVSKQSLSENALGRPLSRFNRSIDVHISSIRRKLGAQPDGSPWITSVRGLGYQLVSKP